MTARKIHSNGRATPDDLPVPPVPAPKSKGKNKSKGKKPAPKRTRSPAAEEAKPLPAVGEKDFRPGNCRKEGGHLASEIIAKAPSWFVPDLVPNRCLTLVVGDPSCGKSSFGAWLCAMASRPAILPGYEEDLACALVPRLKKAGVNLNDCLLMDGYHWSFPHDRDKACDLLRAHQCDLLWVDPIDSYCGETSENDGPVVRTALESICRIASDVDCAVAAARHPGKQAGNICPGSRQWRAVPREIIELRHDVGPPSRRMLRLRKDPYSRGVGPKEFTLEGEHGKPPLFVLGDPMDPAAAESLGVGDRVEQWKIDEAVQLLKGLLGAGEQEAAWVYLEAEKLRLSERTVRYAAARIGVVKRREGVGREHRSFWSLSTLATPAGSESDTP